MFVVGLGLGLGFLSPIPLFVGPLEVSIVDVVNVDVIGVAGKLIEKDLIVFDDTPLGEGMVNDGQDMFVEEDEDDANDTAARLALNKTLNSSCTDMAPLSCSTESILVCCCTFRSIGNSRTHCLKNDINLMVV